MWVYTKAALRDGRKRDPLLDLQLILATIIESVSRVTEDSLWDNEWITETKVTMKENPHSGGTQLRHRSAMPSSVVFAMVFSTDKREPQVRQQRTNVAQFRDAVSSAIELTCGIAVDGLTQQGLDSWGGDNCLVLRA